VAGIGQSDDDLIGDTQLGVCSGERLGASSRSGDSLSLATSFLSLELGNIGAQLRQPGCIARGRSTLMIAISSLIFASLQNLDSPVLSQ
jgi:hypothetical protein